LKPIDHSYPILPQAIQKEMTRVPPSFGNLIYPGLWMNIGTVCPSHRLFRQDFECLFNKCCIIRVLARPVFSGGIEQGVLDVPLDDGKMLVH